MSLVLAPPRPSCASFLEGFESDRKLRGLSPETIRSYHSYLRILADFLDSRDRSFLDVDGSVLKEILRFVLARGAKAKTVRAYFSALSSLFDYLQYEGMVAANPVPPFRKRFLWEYKKRRGEDAGSRRLLSVEEMRTLFGATLDPRIEPRRPSWIDDLISQAIRKST